MINRFSAIQILILFSISNIGHAEPQGTGTILRSVYVCGPEFGNRSKTFSNENPGKYGVDYWFNTAKTFEYLSGKGFRLFRLPIMWERVQPNPGKELDKDYIARIRENIEWAKEYKASVVLTIMNQGRYTFNVEGKSKTYIIEEKENDRVPVSSADFTDLWIRLSVEFKDDESVLAYGLMNEPHDMCTSDWKSLSQAAVSAIRKNGDAKLLLVEGDGWSTCPGWVKQNPEPWITDPEKNFIYEASCFLDADGSGAYKQCFDEELARDPGITKRGVVRLAPFIEWCLKYKVRGSISSFGVPANDPRWLAVLDNTILLAESAGAGWAYWAAGEWWKNYPLSIQPDITGADKPQMKVLEQYLSASK